LKTRKKGLLESLSRNDQVQIANVKMSHRLVPKEIQLSDPVIAAAVLELQKCVYALEAEIIGSRRIPPLLETFADVLESDEMARGVYMKARLVGCIAYKRVGQLIDICKLMVRPECFRMGIGSCLLEDVLATEKHITQVTVATAAKNVPAIHFYLHYGFEESGRQLTVEEIEIVHFRKNLRRL
jgi:ribosomal protein S18 acetylase RimI-like enzyme